MIVSGGEALVDLAPQAQPGGGPMNVAISAARLGVPAAFIGRVSTDNYGTQIWDHLLANNVDVRACERGDERTARAIVEHTPKLVFRFEGENTADTQLHAANLGALGAGPHIVHGGTLGMFRGRTAEVLATLAESHDGLVSLDPNVRPQIIDDRAQWDSFHERWLSKAQFYRASDEDLEWIWPGRSGESCAEQLLAGATEAFVITKGSDGAAVYTNEGEVSAKAGVIDLVDTVGAGDSFVGSVLTSIWEHPTACDQGSLLGISLGEWETIAARAVKASGITCSRVGANPPYRDEVYV